MYNKPTPNPNYKPKAIAPRKVRGGIKLSSASFVADPTKPAPETVAPTSWASQRWMRLIEQAAPGEAMRDGLGYAAAGQTRRLAFEPGRVAASIQGTQYTPYETALVIQPFNHEQAEKLVGAMSDQAVHAAKLLAGELLPTVEDVLSPLGRRLFPTDPAEIEPRCTCREFRAAMGGPGAPTAAASTGPVTVGVSALRQTAEPASTHAPEPAPTSPAPTGPAPSPAPTKPGPIWCKHACCVAYLVGERFATDPFLMFALRGLPKEDLLERLRQRRAVAGSAFGGALVYQPVVPGASDTQSKPLEECIEGFWDAGPELAQIDAPIQRPAVSHPLLRRLGPSPMGGPGKFPLVGLLATCYDVISEAAIKQEEPAPTPGEAPNSSGESTSDPDEA